MTRFCATCTILAAIWACALLMNTNRVSPSILRAEGLETNTRVPAQSAEWINSGVTVEKGRRYAIKATGRWRLGAHCGWTGPDGLGAYTGLLCVDLGNHPLPGYSGAALIARIGSQGAPFHLGNELMLDAVENGVLYFRINDRQGGIYWDNEGFVDVGVTLADKPPTTATAAKETGRPDSSPLEQAKKFYNEGNSYFEAKSYREAVESYKKALEFETGFPPLYYNLAMAQRELGLKREAAANFKRFLELRPDARNAPEVRRLIKSLEK